jgi:hypothetical protein
MIFDGMVTDGGASEGDTCGVKAMVFDFDSTISQPHKIPRFAQWAIADKVDIMSTMTSAEIVTNFGGKERISALSVFFSALQASGIELFIISIGFKIALVPHLDHVGLSSYFQSDRIWGQDCAELRAVKYVKAQLIHHIMTQNGWIKTDLLFVDDSASHIQKAQDTCLTLEVAGNGMSFAEMQHLINVARGKTHQQLTPAAAGQTAARPAPLMGPSS